MTARQRGRGTYADELLVFRNSPNGLYIDLRWWSRMGG